MPIDDSRSFGKRECPSCACEVPANNNRCPICGYEFPNWMPRGKGILILVAILALAAFLAMILL